MTKNTCIICGGPAGSREHVFPASFGGRRKDKGIYCGPHNQSFGRHVSALLAELEIVNAAFGVRPDGKKTVRPATVRSPDGQEFLFAKNSTRLAPPPSLVEGTLPGQLKQMQFADMAEARKWLEQQKKQGFEVKIVGPATYHTSIATESYQFGMHLGQPSFRRAILYFGLTFLAHHWSERAHATGLAAVKKELERADTEDMVVDIWWEPPSVLEQLPANPFPYGHSVTVAVDSGGNALALVSLWGGIQYGMELGQIDAAGPERIVTFINPLEDYPPKDRVVVHEAGLSLNLGNPERGRAYLEKVVAGDLPNPVAKILAAASEAELRGAARELLEKLRQAHSHPDPMRDEAYLKAITGVKQRVFNLLKKGIEEFLKQDPKLASLAPILGLLYQADPSGKDGLTDAANAMLSAAIMIITAELKQRMEQNTLDEEAVALLIGGGPGMALVFRDVVVPVLLGP